MPIYEYRCADCDDIFEVLVLRPTDDSQPCPNCRSEKTEKLLSVTAGIISQGDSFTNCPMSMGGCPAASAGMGGDLACGRGSAMGRATRKSGGSGCACPMSNLD